MCVSGCGTNYRVQKYCLLDPNKTMKTDCEISTNAFWHTSLQPGKTLRHLSKTSNLHC